MNASSQRRVLAISDGVAGNENQAVALAHALGVEPEVLRLSPRVPWRWFAPHRLPGAAHALGNGFMQWLDRDMEKGSALAIGCGRQAALATRLLRESGKGTWQAVQILAPRIAPSHYDLVIAPRHDGLMGDNVITTLGGLNRIDDAWLEQARAAFPALGDLPTPRHALLLGGPTRALDLDRDYWQALARLLRQQLERDGGSLMVSSSRRTPDWLREAVRHAFSGLPVVQWHGPGDGDNPYAGLLGWADLLVVTPDSVNMLSEAAATRVPVWTFTPSAVRGKVGRFVDELRSSGRIGLLGGNPASHAITPLRETPRVAAEIRTRLGWS